MYKDFEHDIWETSLKAAVIESCMDELKDYPSDEELNKLVLPKRYDAKMRRFIKQYKHRDNTKSVLKVSRKIASVIIVIFGISFVVLLPFKEVRAACRTVIVDVYKRYIEFHFISHIDTVGTSIEFGYVPKGFSLVQNDINEWGENIEYENASGKKIRLSFRNQKYTLQIDNEHYTISEVSINDSAGKFFDAQEEQLDNYLVWDTLDGYYVLSSSLDEKDLMKIAINLR